jgi:hypothetical protein
MTALIGQAQRLYQTAASASQRAAPSHKNQDHPYESANRHSNCA